MIDYRFYYDSFSLVRDGERDQYNCIKLEDSFWVTEHLAGRVEATNVIGEKVSLPSQPLVVGGKCKVGDQTWFAWGWPRCLTRCQRCGLKFIKTPSGKVCPQGHGKLILCMHDEDDEE